MPSLHLRGPHNLQSVPARVHEAPADLQLRVPEPALRQALSSASQRPVHAADDPVHQRGRLRPGPGPEQRDRSQRIRGCHPDLRSLHILRFSGWHEGCHNDGHVPGRHARLFFLS